MTTSTHIVLLHGLALTPLSWWCVARALRQAGYTVHLPGYPTTRYSIDELVQGYIAPVLLPYCMAGQPVHVVAHSLGAILLRVFLQQHSLPSGSKIVLLAPPNHGSEIVDAIGNWWLFKKIMGKAGQDLGTKAWHKPQQLHAIAGEIGILAGNFALDFWFWHLFTGPCDGKVTVFSTQLAEMQDFRILPFSHTFMLGRQKTCQEILHFLVHGCFTPVA